MADLTAMLLRYVDSAVVDEWNSGRTRLGQPGSSRCSAASFPLGRTGGLFESILRRGQPFDITRLG